tara:strand:+ start:100155 stop:100325 length:171 start_codon:yes stop_codon:yes gene_type:complete
LEEAHHREAAAQGVWLAANGARSQQCHVPLSAPFFKSKLAINAQGIFQPGSGWLYW